MKYNEHEVSGLLSPLIDSTRCRLVSWFIPAGKSILDVGCGNGQMIPYLKAPASYLGIDMDADIIEWCRVKYPSCRFETAKADAGSLPSGKYDAIILSGVIEHIEPSTRQALLNNVRALLNKDGLVVLATPTVFGGLFHKWMSWVGLASREAAEEHKGFLSKADMAQLFAETGFEITKHSYYFCGMAHIVCAKPGKVKQ